jgi:hypothetical protein
MSKHRTQPRRGRRIAISALAALSLAGTGVVAAQSSQAAGLLPTTTTVTATPSTAGERRNVHLVATVKVLGLPGLGVLPTGTVTFTSDDANTNIVGLLGTAKLGFCLLTACTATFDTTDFVQGADTYTATYSGDTVSKASAATGSVTITRNVGDYSNNSSVSCLKGSRTCDAGLITDGGGTWLDTFTDDNVGATANHTVAEQVGAGTLGCASAASGGAGALATFTDTPAVSSYKHAVYTVTDSLAASNLAAAFTAHPSYIGCYASDTPFLNGQTNAPATQNPADGNLYEGPLPSCGYVSFGTAVCFDAFPDTNPYGETAPGDFQVSITWGFGTPADPKFVG